jgi:hypothetical protein
VWPHLSITVTSPARVLLTDVDSRFCLLFKLWQRFQQYSNVPNPKDYCNFDKTFGILSTTKQSLKKSHKSAPTGLYYCRCCTYVILALRWISWISNHISRAKDMEGTLITRNPVMFFKTSLLRSKNSGGVKCLNHGQAYASRSMLWMDCNNEMG